MTYFQRTNIKREGNADEKGSRNKVELTQIHIQIEVMWNSRISSASLPFEVNVPKIVRSGLVSMINEYRKGISSIWKSPLIHRAGWRHVHISYLLRNLPDLSSYSTHSQPLLPWLTTHSTYNPLSRVAKPDESRTGISNLIERGKVRNCNGQKDTDCF